jgi:Na+-driven multidrug efflux pump
MPAPQKNDSSTDLLEPPIAFREGSEKKTSEAGAGCHADLPETKYTDSRGEHEKENDQKKDRRIYILSREKPALAVVKLGVPLIAGMFIMVLYNMVDTYFIGLMRDDYQLAAVNLAYPVMMISIAISNMIGTGASSLIARSLGAEDRAKARHTLTVGFELTIINSLLVTAAGMAFLTAIVRGLGAQSNTFEYTRQYVQVILLGSIFTMGNYTSGQLLRSEGSVKYSVAGMIIGTVVNIILDPVFIFTLGLQIRGAAIATILGNAAGMLVSLWIYGSGKTLLTPSLQYLKPILPQPHIHRHFLWHSRRSDNGSSLSLQVLYPRQILIILHTYPLCF